MNCLGIRWNIYLFFMGMCKNNTDQTNVVFINDISAMDNNK